MFDQIDSDYLLGRAREERRKAAALNDPVAAEQHLQMAEIFEEKAVQLGGIVDTD